MSLFRSTLLLLLIVLFSSPAVSNTEDWVDPDCPHLQVLMTKVPGFWHRDDLEYQEVYRRSFGAHLNQQGFKVIHYSGDLETAPTWYLYSQVLDLQNGTFVWTWEFKKQPTIRDGLLHFAKFKNEKLADTDKFFFGIRGLLVTTPSMYDGDARRAGELISGIFMDYARELCQNQGSTLDELISLRKELVLEIERERARAREALQVKTLNLEIEE
jgi:hypothetical protein